MPSSPTKKSLKLLDEFKEQCVPHQKTGDGRRAFTIALDNDLIRVVRKFRELSYKYKRL
jgi:hypothetical protein